MAYTFNDQQNKLSSLLGESNQTSDDAFPTAIRQKELNRGEWQFAVDAMDLKEYATGTISGMQIAVPADFISVFTIIFTSSSGVKISLTNSREISIKDIERFYNYNADRPFYYIWDYLGTKYIKFLGSTALTNGFTYELYYYKKPTTELVNTTDISLHREEYREAPAFYAAAQLMQQIGKFNQSTQFMQQYQSYVERMKEIVSKEALDKDDPQPDFGVGNITATDVQGRTYVQ